MMNDAIIDVHAHYQPRILNAFMGRFGNAMVIPNVPWTDTAEHLEDRVRLMDGARVRLQILSPGTAHYFDDARARAKRRRSSMIRSRNWLKNYLPGLPPIYHCPCHTSMRHSSNSIAPHNCVEWSG